MGDCLELFGVDRCMFASNLPVDLVTMSPRQRWADLGASAQGRGLTTPQLEALFRGNCLRYYGIEASAPPSPPQTLAPSAPPLHVKARGQHPLYPVRAIVADHQVSWTASWAEYTPVEYTAEKVLANDATVNPSGWADPPDPSVLEPHAWAERGSHESPLLFNAKRFPMNPRGRSGMGGRGLLGKWGPNFAADPIVTRWHASLGAPPLACRSWSSSGATRASGLCLVVWWTQRRRSPRRCGVSLRRRPAIWRTWWRRRPSDD